MKAMDLQKIIKHHKREAEHWRRMGALPAAEFNTEAARALEDIERRFGERITEGDSGSNLPGRWRP
jgi:hypothetical protein